MSVSKGEDNGSFGAQNSSVSGGWGRRATGNKIKCILDCEECYGKKAGWVGGKF